MARATVLLAVLWLSFVVRGFWYCALLPPWEGYDEPYHFAALQNVAAGRGMPQSDTPISLEVQNSLHLLPLPWELQFQAIPRPLLTYDDFWRLPAADRMQRIGAVRALEPEQGVKPANEPILNYESQQAPLYYWLVAVPLGWMSGIPLLARLYLLRVLNVLLASVVVPVCWWMARRVLRSELQALGATAIVVVMPEFMINVARVGNQSLALVFFSLLLAAALQVVRRPMSWWWWGAMGCALGAGLLTMASFLTAIPAVAMVGVILSWASGGKDLRNPTISAISRRGCAALVAAAAIAGPWYAHVHEVTGSWSGLGHDAALHHLSLLQKLAAVPHVNWKSGVASVVISHIWFGGWSFLRVPLGLYLIGIMVMVVAVAGVFTRLYRHRAKADEISDVLVLAAFYLCFWAGLAYHVLITFLHEGVSASTGWYLYAVVTAEVILAVWGLETFFAERRLLPWLTIAMAGLDIYGTHALLMPYYTGLTIHADRFVPPAFWLTVTHLTIVFDRLSELRPAWLSATVLLTWWIAYWVATLGTVVAVAQLFRKLKTKA